MFKFNLLFLVVLTANILPIHADQALLAYIKQDPYYTGPASSDADLERKIIHKITTGWFAKDFKRVRVSVKEGRVTLTGVVRTEDDKKRLAETILGINGVVHIDSRLEVLEADKSR